MPDKDQVTQAASLSEEGNPEARHWPLTKAFLISGLTLFSVVLLVYGSEVLVPLVVALLLWFLINAIANIYQRLWSRWWGPLRGLSLFLALLTMLAASLLAIVVVIENVSAMSESSTDFERSLNILLSQVSEFTGLKQEEMVAEIAEQLGLGKLLGSIVSAMTNFASAFGIVFVYVIFLLVEQQLFDRKLNAIIRDESRRQQIRSLLDRVGRDIQSYLWIMGFVSLLTAGLSYPIMVAVGLEHASFWAFLIFILNFIPTVGSILATLIPSFYGLLQFADFRLFFILLVSIGIIQFLIGNVLQPRLSARRLNLSQFVVILSLFVWGAIWGVVGMFLAVPITAIMMIVFANFRSTRVVAAILSESGDVPPPNAKMDRRTLP